MTLKGPEDYLSALSSSLNIFNAIWPYIHWKNLMILKSKENWQIGNNLQKLESLYVFF